LPAYIFNEQWLIVGSKMAGLYAAFYLALGWFRYYRELTRRVALEPASKLFLDLETRDYQQALESRDEEAIGEAAARFRTAYKEVSTVGMENEPKWKRGRQDSTDEDPRSRLTGFHRSRRYRT
jgi:hypothetical protein